MVLRTSVLNATKRIRIALLLCLAMPLLAGQLCISPSDTSDTSVGPDDETSDSSGTTKRFTLTVETDGQGSVTPGTGSYRAGTTVTLTALADTCWRFSHWEGDVSEDRSSVSITIRRATTLRAVFVELTYPPPPPLDVCTEPGNADDLIATVLDLLNQERTARGLTPLVLNDTLAAIADDYCCEMIEGAFFAHENPLTGEGPADRAVAAGYEYRAVGENLAAGQCSADEVMTGWMNSEGHRENILRPDWVEVGISVRNGGEYGVYWAQEFGWPR